MKDNDRFKVSFSGPTVQAIRVDMQAFLDETRSASMVRPIQTTPVGSGDGSVEPDEAGDALTEERVRLVLASIPPGRKARDFLRLLAEAGVEGRLALWPDVLGSVADGNGQRFAGYVQGITKVAYRVSGGTDWLWTWDKRRKGWWMSPAVARVIIMVLDEESEG